MSTESILWFKINRLCWSNFKYFTIILILSKNYIFVHLLDNKVTDIRANMKTRPNCYLLLVCWSGKTYLLLKPSRTHRNALVSLFQSGCVRVCVFLLLFGVWGLFLYNRRNLALNLVVIILKHHKSRKLSLHSCSLAPCRTMYGILLHYIQTSSVSAGLCKKFFHNWLLWSAGQWVPRMAVCYGHQI